MPELPDLETYLSALRARLAGQRLEGVRLASPFLLRSVEPPLSDTAGRMILGFHRLGKRIVFELEDELYLVLHLMLAGRLQWRAPRAAIPKRRGLAAFDAASGTLVLTEAGTTKRASLVCVAGREALADHDPGGIEPLEVSSDRFAEALTRENRTVKRALTDPRILAGIGNAYSDEILHAAKLSPFKRTRELSAAEHATLYKATRTVLADWTERLLVESEDSFPNRVIAFRPEMAVHGRYREPCPDCSEPIQRILYARSEANYCPTCQTGGKLLADRVLSKLLKDDWPKTLAELEERKRPPR